MLTHKFIVQFALLISMPLFGFLQTANPRNEITVPLGGNTFISGHGTGNNISDKGIVNWTLASTAFNTYIRITRPVTVKLYLRLQVPEGKSRIKIAIQGRATEIDVENKAFTDQFVGEWNLADTGYIACNISGIAKSGKVFANISDIRFEGPAIDNATSYVKDNTGNFFYWGRRGPSVHLNYVLPVDQQAEWFYNEVTVPQGQDVIGSYFMANGFAEGYFGIQVNSKTERRILFSVWSPFKTDSPQQIPEDQKILLLKKGGNVHAGEFGNEGSGGQSYLQYSWKAGSTYRFLLHARPEDSSHTVFSAYFYSPESKKWMLIASFKRPKTNTYLKRLHSFLENFIPEQGDIQRMGLFTNQWVCNPQGTWLELTKARFTGDNTAVKGYRMDYAGGMQQQAFYLRNGGFFNEYTSLNKILERSGNGKPPVVDLTNLP